MPQVLHELCFPPGLLGLWTIEEPEDWLRDQIALDIEEESQLVAIKGGGRRREFLAARVLLHRLSRRNRLGALVKDQFGKPRLVDSSFHISISHTNGLSAAYAHPSPCGVDVQRLVSKIHRIAPKFINDREQDQLEQHQTNLLEQQHLIWSAKEAMYKAYGLKQLDFKAHLTIQLPEVFSAEGSFTGILKKGDLHINYDLYYRRLEDTLLVVGVDSKPFYPSGPL
ncbi:MAG: 4'-phosphopantetheinyl transferase superfamily protein [Bacteroidota bacterium]